MSARRRISSSSLRRWAEESVDLLMVCPLLLFSAFLPAGDGEQILGDHAPAHIAFKSMLSFIKRARHGEGMFQMADGGFDSGTPAQSTLEPALLLVLGALARQASPCWQSHVLHSQLFRLAFILSGKETAVRSGQVGCSAEVRLMLFYSG